MADDKYLLHVMNTLRIPFIRDGLLESGKIKPDLDNSGKPFENLSILNVGCGGGALTEPLAKLGGKMVGLDADAKELQVAKSHAALNSNLTNLKYLDENLDDHSESQPGQYDAVIISGVIEYIFNPEAVLIQSVKCLKPGGSIFVIGLNQTVGSYFISTLFYEKILKIIPKGTCYGAGSTHFISPLMAKSYLEKFGCSVKAIRGMKYNIFSQTVEWTDTTSFYYALHAVKKI